MKFGEHLNKNKSPEYGENYVNYDELKRIIRELEDSLVGTSLPSETTLGKFSISTQPSTNSKGQPIEDTGRTSEAFFSLLESDMKKIENCTRRKVEEIRHIIIDAEKEIETETEKGLDQVTYDRLNNVLKAAGDQFLKLEKYVNINFTAFSKILKKHDKRLPNPCRAFYIARLHDQSWVKGDFSDVIVSLSRAFCVLRGDEEAEQKDTEAQAFVRSTRKYWVNIEDVSRVKYLVLQHLPVFLQNNMAGETDSQLINSVYVDNTQMELYHGRLDKTPGAIALRFRWYGSGNPETVFVERKTHRDSWTGEVSVKERFIVKEDQVIPLLHHEYNIEAEEKKLRAKGKKDEEISEWRSLAEEVLQAINSKQLLPTLRSQYMRTAFQIPFDATVRISLDTNLCMIGERTAEQLKGTRWYRDPSKPVPKGDITRFPHAVLEVKLQLQDEGETPAWVTELIHSGMLMEVHKFSKFIHGCAVLFPDEVRAFPYWVDDPTLKASILQSGAGGILADDGGSSGANQTTYPQLLPHDEAGLKRNNHIMLNNGRSSPRNGGSSIEMPSYQSGGGSASIEEGNSNNNIINNKSNSDSVLSAPSQNSIKRTLFSPKETEDSNDCYSYFCDWAGKTEIKHVTQQKVEPKLFFANERTFIKWLEMAVVMSSISIGVMAFSGNNSDAQYFAMMCLPLSLLFIVYALYTYLWRSDLISTRDASRWDDPVGPVVLTSLLILALSVLWCMKLKEFIDYELD